jgi:hypothetical protein
LGLEVEAINTSGVNSVWARDLVFGIFIKQVGAFKGSWVWILAQF